MARIDLKVLRFPNRTALTTGYSLTTVRIVAEVRLEGRTATQVFDTAIVDTGAPVSLFPPSVWRGADFDRMGDVSIGGVIDRDECRIRATLARVECTLSDGATTIGPLAIHAYLAASDRAPTLLGLADLLDRTVLHCEVAADRAYLEM